MIVERLAELQHCLSIVVEISQRRKRWDYPYLSSRAEEEGVNWGVGDGVTAAGDDLWALAS